MATLNIKNFPDDLHERLKRHAAAQHRSLAGEVIHRLERSVEHAEALSILELRGLGKERWRGLDAAEHIAGERDAWD